MTKIIETQTIILNLNQILEHNYLFFVFLP